MLPGGGLLLPLGLRRGEFDGGLPVGEDLLLGDDHGVLLGVQAAGQTGRQTGHPAAKGVHSLAVHQHVHRGLEESVRQDDAEEADHGHAPEKEEIAHAVVKDHPGPQSVAGRLGGLALDAVVGRAGPGGGQIARQGLSEGDDVTKLEFLMKKSGIDISDRRVIGAALVRAESTGGPAVALELPDGQIVTGKTTDLLGPASAALLNALKTLAGISHSIPLISPNVIEPISDLKVNHMGNHNPRLHTDEVLIALAISATTNPVAELAMQQIGKLEHSDLHSTTMLSSVDLNMLHKLGIEVTCEPVYQTKKLYHK